jgi:hypothetical protein
VNVYDQLLQPAGPEVSCDECFELLDAYVEHVLPERVVPAMSAHLDGCPACREDYESLRDLLAEEA